MTASDPVRPPVGAPNKTMITLVMMLGAVIQVLDTTIANVALPHMQGSLGATQDQISWVLTSYIVASAIMTPATGWIAGRIGRTRLFVISLVGFTLVSVLCGIAGSLSEMVAFRVLQGLFGAALVPVSQAIMLDIYPREEHGRAIAIWSIGVLVGPILGPTIGGYLTEAFSWRWCFYINLPLGILAVLGTIAFVPETARLVGRKFDWFGFTFLSLAVAAVQFVLDRGEQKGWFQSAEIQIEAVIAAFGLYMFVVHSMTARKPFIDIRLFQDRTFMACVLLQLSIVAVFYGSMVLSPQMLQVELHYPVFTAGLVMAPRGLGTIAAMLLVARLSKRLDPRILVGSGLSIMAVALYLMSIWSLNVGRAEITYTGILQGFGQGFVFGPVMGMALSNLPTELRTEASGFFNLMRNIGGAVGVSVAVAQLTQLVQLNHARLTEFITPFQRLPGESGPLSAGTLEMLNLNITHQAGMVAYINVYRILAMLCIAVFPLIFLLRPVKKAAPDRGALAAAAAD